MTTAPRQGLTPVPRPNAVSGTADRLMRLRPEADMELHEPAATTGSGLSFEGPLDRLSLNPLNRSAEHFTRLDSRDDFILDAPYQRGSVWDETRKQQLIRSMLLGLPIGNIVINHRPDIMDGYAVVDGRQRVEAMRDFADSKFPVPASWLREEWVENPVAVEGWPVPGVYFDGATTAFQRYMGMRVVPTVEASVKTIAEEAEVFRLINSGGVAQTAETLANAAAVENA